MRAMTVVIEGELRQHCVEMPLVDHDHMIETLAANRADVGLPIPRRGGRRLRSSCRASSVNDGSARSDY